MRLFHGKMNAIIAKNGSAIIPDEMAGEYLTFVIEFDEPVSIKELIENLQGYIENVHDMPQMHIWPNEGRMSDVLKEDK